MLPHRAGGGHPMSTLREGMASVPRQPLIRRSLTQEPDVAHPLHQAASHRCGGHAGVAGVLKGYHKRHPRTVGRRVAGKPGVVGPVAPGLGRAGLAGHGNSL